MGETVDQAGMGHSGRSAAELEHALDEEALAKRQDADSRTQAAQLEIAAPALSRMQALLRPRRRGGQLVGRAGDLAS